MMTYDWANTVKRENTTELVFPNMQAGDVLIHNFTVWHGVAPLEKGERFSFVLFYDMDNPILDDLHAKANEYNNDEIDVDEAGTIHRLDHHERGVSRSDRHGRPSHHAATRKRGNHGKNRQTCNAHG